MNNQLEEVKVYGEEKALVIRHHMSNEFDSIKKEKRIIS